jgi:integrase
MGVKVRDDPPGSGVWFIYVNHKGKRFAKRVGTDKRKAQQIAKQVEQRLAAGDLGLLPKDEPKTPTVEQYGDRFLAAIEHRVKHSTYVDYEISLRLRIVPALGPKRLDEVTRAGIKDFATGLRQSGNSLRNVRKTIATLSSMLSEAVDDGHIGANPASKLGKLFRSPEFTDGDMRRAVNPLSREELTHLLETARTHAIERAGKVVHPYRAHYPFLLLLARTGLRLGEAVALKWGDLDPHGAFLEVRRAFVMGRITTPKNKKTRRVDLSAQLREALSELWADRFERVVAIDAEAQAALETARAGALDAYIFSDADRPMDPDNFRTASSSRC